MQQTNKKQPFFARFLESQDLEPAAGACGGQPQTRKYPSDTEDGNNNNSTKKYPSDNEEGGGYVTLKYPSDSEDS